MKNIFYQKQWNWKVSGVALVKPIGVSTQFVILDGIIWDFFANDVVIEDTNAHKGYSSINPYLNRSGRR